MTIEEIYKSKWFNKMITTVIQMNKDTNYLKDELRSEITLILLEQGEKVEKLGDPKAYVWSIIRNQYQSSSSPFHKKWRTTEYIDENFDLSDDNYEHDDRYNKIELERLHDKLNSLHPAETILIKMFFKIGEFGIGGEWFDAEHKSLISNTSRINKLTGIPKKIIEVEVENILKKLRNEL
jgi:hypothetical protein